jgi:hypothetical protein
MVNATLLPYTCDFRAVKLGSLMARVGVATGKVSCTKKLGNPEEYLALPQLMFRVFW